MHSLIAQTELTPPTPTTTADLLWWAVVGLCTVVATLFGMLVKQQAKYISDLTSINDKIELERKAIQSRFDEELKRKEEKWETERKSLNDSINQERQKNEQLLLRTKQP